MIKHKQRTLRIIRQKILRMFKALKIITKAQTADGVSAGLAYGEK